MTSLLAQHRAAVRERLERERLAVRKRLTAALEGLPGLGFVWAYGSVTREGAFREDSDVDLAVERLPDEVSLYLLQSLLSEAAGREVDVCLLAESRLREKIEREGERWI